VLQDVIHSGFASKAMLKEVFQEKKTFSEWRKTADSIQGEISVAFPF
jgi:hypothetical protein